jgi:hypothetical protein
MRVTVLDPIKAAPAHPPETLVAREAGWEMLLY